MKSLNKEKSRKFLSIRLWLGILFAALTLPFLTLVSIDMVGLWTSENESQKTLRENAITKTLVDRIQRSENWNNTSLSSMNLMTLTPSCYRIHVDRIENLYDAWDIEQPADHKLRFIQSRMILNDYLIQKFALRPSFQAGRAADTLTSAQASALNACIAVTAFSNWCVEKFHQKIAASKKKFEDGLVDLEMHKKIEGPKAGQVSYCTNAPELVLAGQTSL